MGINKPSYTVIGANSYIARHIVNRLFQNDEQVHLFDKSPSSIDNFTPYNSIDITDFDEIQNIKTDSDFIFVFSGLTGTLQGFENYKSFISVNETGLLNILTLLRERKSKSRIIFPSSRLVYKGNNQALKEDDEKDFKTIYAMNKFSCENYLKIYYECFGIPYTIFRICVPYGNVPGSGFSYGTLGHFVNAARQGKDITIFGNGAQKRSFIHVQDLSDIILKAIQHPSSKNEVFNVGGPDVLTVSQVAQAIANLYGVKVKYENWPLLQEKIETGDTFFDSSKIENLTGYSYKFNFDLWLGEQKNGSQ